MSVVALTEGRFDEFVALLEALADYEHLPPPDSSAIERLRRDAFGTGPRFEAALALDAGRRAVGYATWFHTYSTFLAKPTMYLEDLFVLESARGTGAGSGRSADSTGCGGGLPHEHHEAR